MGGSGKRGSRRRAAGRHAATRSWRRGLGRRWAAGAVGAVALAGGVAAVLGANGTFGANGSFGGALTAASAQQARPAPPARSEPENGSAALPGKGVGTTGVRASAEAKTRELPKSEPPSRAAPVSPAAVSPRAVSPSGVEQGLVPGTTDAQDLLAGGPDPGEAEGYKANGPSRHTDQQAAEYFRTHWGPDDKALKRLKDIRTVGGYLRIYTDLPETAGNSSSAITLCERGLAYLRARGVAHPVVFVQAEFGENGNPVLANILGPSDTTCRVTHPAPD
ncbi:hypothetical protein ACFPOI_46020 [Nonomuraea angiospora]|uniref:Uncharacterized protein n=1 Tax=Nonomuraea angiospora TaxID=46172 RepID=A0ABR9LYV7_9ACTN|nr:hypothetical protein [Nonomuraea angiospora]MBE1585824.1 hypothetical protein [Nonomuraea angiospora]